MVSGSSSWGYRRILMAIKFLDFFRPRGLFKKKKMIFESINFVRHTEGIHLFVYNK